MSRLINYRELKRQFELEPDKQLTQLTELLESKKVKPEDFSIRDLAEAVVPDGREWVSNMNPRHGGGTLLLESDAVKMSQFSNITKQIVYTKLMTSFESEEFVFTKLVPTVPTQFNGERIPGIGGIGDEMEVVDEAQPFPKVGVNEDYIDVPPGKKRGAIVPVTKEAIFFDRTGDLLRQCGKVGEFLGLNKEKRIIDAIIDENVTDHRHKWKGTTYATYQSSTPWVNLSSSNSALVDWTDVEILELLLAAITDPNTGEPVMVTPKHIVVTPSLLHTARYILGATGNRRHVGGYATSGNLVEVQGPNTLDNYTIISSRLLAARMATDTHWYLGNIPEAVNYFENWPIKVEQAPPNSQAEFDRDIVMQFKASERGQAYVVQPRVMSKSSA